MKKPFTFVKIRLVFITVTLFITCAVIYSCRKDIKESLGSTAATSTELIKVNIANLKGIYNKAVKGTTIKPLSGNTTLDLIRTLDVNWDTYTLQKRRDSSVIAEFDMKTIPGCFC